MTASVLDIRHGLPGSPLLWVAATLLVYRGACWIQRRSGGSPMANPVAISVAAIVAVLLCTGTPYETYAGATQLVQFLVGPATVALAIPLYSHIGRVKAMAGPLAVALLAGSAAAIGSAVLLGWLTGGSAETIRSLAPKSATMPIAMGVSEQSCGLPALTALAVAITGISGAIMARGLFRLLRIADPAVRGFAIGVTAHAIGTAHALQTSQVAGAFAALGMGLNGVLTALLVPLLLRLIGPG